MELRPPYAAAAEITASVTRPKDIISQRLLTGIYIESPNNSFMYGLVDQVVEFIGHSLRRKSNWYPESPLTFPRAFP